MSLSSTVEALRAQEKAHRDHAEMLRAKKAQGFVTTGDGRTIDDHIKRAESEADAVRFLIEEGLRAKRS